MPEFHTLSLLPLPEFSSKIIVCQISSLFIYLFIFIGLTVVLLQSLSAVVPFAWIIQLELVDEAQINMNGITAFKNKFEVIS